MYVTALYHYAKGACTVMYPMNGEGVYALYEAA